MNLYRPLYPIETLLRFRPHAWARLKGSAVYPDITGTVNFYAQPEGTLVIADVQGLPNPQSPCLSPVFGFHIHEGGACTGNEKEPFADTLGHFNPRGCAHPHHAGDMPPLFGAGGRAFSAFLTDRFLVQEIIGRTVIVHSSPDDFTTQPSGNAGNKIACGEIMGRIR